VHFFDLTITIVHVGGARTKTGGSLQLLDIAFAQSHLNLFTGDTNKVTIKVIRMLGERLLNARVAD